MKKSRYSDVKIMAIIKQADASRVMLRTRHELR